MMEILGDIGWVGSALGAVAFVITYTFVSPWWRSPAGRFLWGFAAVVTLIMALASVRLLFGYLPGIIYIRAFAYLGLAAVIWAAEIALIRVQVWNRIKARFSRG